MTTPESRSQVIETLYTLLSTALVGTGLPVQAIHKVKMSDFGGQGPVVVVLDAGIQRQTATQGEKRFRNYVRVEVNVFVPTPRTGWTAQDAETARYTIEQLIAGVVVDNRQVAGAWSFLDYGPEYSETVEFVDAGGNRYELEVLPLLATVYRA
jgi:short subunit dehydrogenase-like uncharacterized protein